MPKIEQWSLNRVEQMETAVECNRLRVLLHSAKTPQDAVEAIPDDTILIQAIKRGLIDSSALVESPAARHDTPSTVSESDKVIPIASRRKASMER